MSFIVTCRYDYNSPLELAKIIEFLKTFEKVIGCLETVADGEKKDHVHARIEHDLSPMSFGRRLKLICPFLKRSKKGHHWLQKNGVHCCARESHNPPHLPEKCSKYGSFCYTLKSGNHVLIKGYDITDIEEWINIGASIKRTKSLVLYKKVISYAKLKRLSTLKDITYGLKQYYNEVRGIPLPHYQDFRLILTLDQIVYTLHPHLAIKNLHNFQELCQQRYI